MKLSDKDFKGMPGNFDSKTLKLKWGDTHAIVRGVLTVVTWKDKRDVCILINMHKPPAEHNLYDECG